MKTIIFFKKKKERKKKCEYVTNENRQITKSSVTPNHDDLRQGPSLLVSFLQP